MEKLKEGDSFDLNEVLFTSKGSDINFGLPMIEGGVVKAIFIEARRAKKIDVIKYKQKSRYFKKNGHRQPYLKIKIETI